MVHWPFFGPLKADKKNPRRQSFFFVPEFFYFEKKISLTYLIPIQERKQKGVPNFLNSIIDAPEVMTLRFWV